MPDIIIDAPAPAQPQRDGWLPVDADGNQVYWKSYGDGTRSLLTLHGGPGMPHGYLQPLDRLATSDRTVVFYDQLGAGVSVVPESYDGWTVDACVEQVEAVRTGLGLGQIDLFGNSWGGWLAQSYALAYPENLRTLILSGTSASIAEYLANVQALRVGLGVDKHRVLMKAEASKDFGDPEYLDVIRELNATHLRRAWPFSLERSVREFEKLEEAGLFTPGAAYERMWGPNEFCCTGPLIDWDVTAELGRISTPTLILCGLHDEVTVACSQTLANGIPDNEFVIFGNSSHVNMLEREAELYLAAIDNFINRH